MKMQKTGAFIALMVLVLSMIPATFAQETMSVESMDMEIREMPAVRSAPTGEARAMELRKLQEEREKTRRAYNIRGDIMSLRDSPNDFTGDKALRVVKYAAIVTEELIGKLEAMKSRLMENEDFVASHPNAGARLEVAITELSTLHRELYGVASDGEVTREEWTSIVVPALRKLHSVIGDVRNKQRTNIDEWRQHRSREVAQRIAERTNDQRVRSRLEEMKRTNPNLGSRVEAQMKTVAAKATVIQNKAA